MIELTPGSGVFVYPYVLNILSKTSVSKMARDLLGALYSVPEIEKMGSLTKVPKPIQIAIIGKVEHTLSIQKYNKYHGQVSITHTCKHSAAAFKEVDLPQSFASFVWPIL